MSGKIESKHDSPRSQLSSFTTKLKDKFHSPKVRRSNKCVSRPLEVPVQKTAPKPDNNKCLSQLEEQEKDAVSALRYFKTIVDKMVLDRRVLEMLPGSASQVLEAVLPLVQLEAIQPCSAVSACLACIYQSLANLIRWSDQILLNGTRLDDKETMGTVTTVIKAVLDGVKELVRLTREPQEETLKTPPVKPTPIPTPTTAPTPTPTPTPAPASTYPEHTPSTTTSEAEAAAREGEDRGSMTLTTTCLQSSAQSLRKEPPPPKPPLLGVNTSENGPPALPPKRRSSAPAGPAKVAVVAPMRRITCIPNSIGLHIQEANCASESVWKHAPECEAERVSEDSAECALEQRLSGGGQQWGGDASSLSSRSSSCDQLNRLSGHGPHRTSTETLDTASDPYDSDYDFLQQDMSCVDALPPLGGVLSPVAEANNHEPSSFSFLQPSSPPTPPPPALPEKKRRGHAPQNQAPPERRLSLYDNVNQDEATMPSFSLFIPLFPSMHQEDGPPLSPPPLPEKSRHIKNYMHFMEDYCEPQPSQFYQSSQSQSVYQLRNRHFQEAYQLKHTLPPPALPPKQRQLDTCATEDCPEMQSLDNPQCTNLDLAEDCDLSSLEQEDLSLVNHSEIMSQITLKQENDDGPDVRAGSRDILLVLATETDHEDVVMYSEAFLTTYRTFITPEDLIKKLHFRYSRFCHSPDGSRKTVSQNSFCLLVRVVDELCEVELEEELLRMLMELVFRLLIGGELSLARRLRSNILGKLEQRRTLLSTTLSLRPLAARGVAARPGTLNDFRSLEIAEQLTLLDAELFYKIEIPEVLLWAKEQNEERSPNLTQFTEHFNNMSYWVRSVIMLQERAQDREKLLLKFIKVMKHLRKLNNFNSYLAILSALDSAPLRRLEWQKQTSESLQEYCSLIDSSCSFRAYRTALAEVQPTYPCIPYLGLILQDLTFVHLGNPDLLEGKVNFSKRWQQFNILDSMKCFQQGHYDFKHNDDIVSFFNDFSDHLAEEALWELSLKIKPRNTIRRPEQQDRT